MAHAGQERDALRGPEDLVEGMAEPYSVSYLQGYRSAILDHYRQEKVRLPEDIDTEWTQLIEGCGSFLSDLIPYRL